MIQVQTKFIKGFCPSLKEPIKAADGLLLRIRPHMDCLNVDKLVSLCDLSEKYGSGLMELTNRGSIQIRGIKEKNHNLFLNEIFKRNIIKEKSCINNNNIVLNPFWKKNDQNCRVYEEIIKLLEQLPKLPNKFGFAVDLGKRLYLKNISADIRIESAPNKKILVRADEIMKGKILELRDVKSFIFKLTNWFMKNKKKNTNRMSELVIKKKPPNSWIQDKPIILSNNFLPGNSKIGQIIGIKLGRFHSENLKKLALKSKTSRIRFTPFKMLILENAKNVKDKNFICKSSEPLLNISACSGMKFCSSATIDTFKLARKIKNPLNRKIHVAGCKKNCGTYKNTEVILSGNGNFIDVHNNLRKKENLIKLTTKDVEEKVF